MQSGSTCTPHMSTERTIGWDLGGAHLKVARLSHEGRVERTIQLPCALWQGIDRLRRAIDRALNEIGPARDHAITMTGELTDLFPNREAGVAAILDTMSDCLPGTRLRVYAGDAGFVDPSAALTQCWKIASANWRATAQLVATCVPDAIVLDIGSTTTDIVPVAGSRIRARGTDDASRLASQELLYLGVVRTPLMALSARWPFDGGWTGICNEQFATTADVYRLTNELPTDADQHSTPDNGPKDVEASARRIARMIGRDLEAASLDAWIRLADWLRTTQIELTEAAITRIASAGYPAPDAPLVCAGAGGFLARAIANRGGRASIDFADLLGCSPDVGGVAACAPAVSVALLAQRL